MPDRPPSALPPEWNESAGFRETLLQYFPDPAQNAALRTVAEMLHEHAMECCKWHDRTGSLLWYAIQAAEADLRHLSGFLAYTGAERDHSELSQEEWKLATLASKVSARLARHADRLRRGLDKAGDARPKEPSPAPPAAPLPALSREGPGDGSGEPW